MHPSSEEARILLLGNDPADGQWSMLEYGEKLQQALTSLAENDLQITLRFPDSRRLSPWLRKNRFGRAAAMYLSRYILYPRLLRKETAGLTHILDHGNASLIRFLDPSRTVISCHDLIPLVLGTWRKSYFPWFSRQAFREALSGLCRAARILTISECTKKDIVERLGYDPGRISVAPMGIDPSFRPASSPEETARAKRALRLPGGTWVAHVGQTASYKNIDGILQALCHLDKSVQLVRAGPLFKPAQRLLASRLGVLDRVHELGPISKAQLIQLYQAADLLLYPSWYEGQGLPPLEAMACNLPAVVSDRGALPETVGDAALAVDPSSPEKISGAVSQVLNHPELRTRLQTAGLKRAAQFRWETTARKTLEAYRSLRP